MKVIFSSTIPIVVLCMTGVLNMSRLQDAPLTSKAETAVVPVTTPALKMWTNNTTLHFGETLSLHFSTPNASCLGVIDPKGHFFYLVYPGDGADIALKPLVDSETFATMQTLELNSATLLADPYTYGVYTNLPVFTVSGNYTFILGENLHIDEPGLLHPLVIHYVHQPAVSSAIATK